MPAEAFSFVPGAGAESAPGAFSAPAAIPRRNASIMLIPRASPTPVAANIESPVPRSSNVSNTGGAAPAV